MHINLNLLTSIASNHLLSGGLEPVLSHTEKLCIASYYEQLSAVIKMYNYKIKTSFFSPEILKRYSKGGREDTLYCKTILVAKV